MISEEGKLMQGRGKLYWGREPTRDPSPATLWWRCRQSPNKELPTQRELKPPFLRLWNTGSEKIAYISGFLNYVTHFWSNLAGKTIENSWFLPKTISDIETICGKYGLSRVNI